MANQPADAADEAGGEAVFSSDGLPPITPQRPPSIQIQEHQGEDELDSGSGMDATQAFEVFAGKLYAPPSTSRYHGEETPWQRLARLKSEVEELEKDLETTTMPDVTKVAAELTERIEAASTKYSLQQEQLTAALQRQVKDWKTTEKVQEETKPGIVYELYAAPPDGPPTSQTEERILKLENIVGSSDSSESLLQRLDELEKRVKQTDPKILDDAATKAKVIRADLEAASKARNKIAHIGSNAADAKKINELYDQMVQLDGFVEHLPALVYRLQQLSTLHNQTSTFASRLTLAEQEIASSQQTLLSLEETFSKLETGMEENLKVMEQNMLKLDERMKKSAS